MEAEIQRRKEHVNEATNFEKARGFVRTNWKTKYWNPNDDPTQFESSTDSEDECAEHKVEKRDTIKDLSPDSRAHKSSGSSAARDNFEGSGVFDGTQSLNLTNQLSDSKMRKRLYQ